MTSRSLHRIAAPAAVLALAASAAAEPIPDGGPGARAELSETAGGASAALGLSASWQLRRDFGGDQRANFAPELVGVLYVGTPLERLYLRPGARLGFSGLEQAEMPRSIRLREWDAGASAALAAVYDGPVIPSLGAGAGLVARWIRADTAEPLQGDASMLDRSELLPALHAQLGLGVPLGGGRLLLEPFARYEQVFGDARIGWRFGMDATITLF